MRVETLGSRMAGWMLRARTRSSSMVAGPARLRRRATDPLVAGVACRRRARCTAAITPRTDTWAALCRFLIDDSGAFCVGGFDDSSLGISQIVQPCALLRLKALVFDG